MRSGAKLANPRSGRNLRLKSRRRTRTCRRVMIDFASLTFVTASRMVVASCENSRSNMALQSYLCLRQFEFPSDAELSQAADAVGSANPLGPILSFSYMSWGCASAAPARLSRGEPEQGSRKRDGLPGQRYPPPNPGVTGPFPSRWKHAAGGGLP